MKHLTQLLRASVAQGRRRQQARLGQVKTRRETRIGRCVCGQPVTAHFGGRNQMLGCAHAGRMAA